jgi:hypothetical protein
VNRYIVFHLTCLALSVVVGFSAGAAHNDPLLKVAIVLSLIFFAGACVAWDINNPPARTHNPKEEDQ